MVWSKTREVLSNPNIILRDLAETSDKTDLDSLDAEILSLEKALRKFKTKLKREGVIDEWKRREYYEKPSQQRRKQREAARRRERRRRREAE